ncbi:MAG: hypothetical protein ACYCZX_04475 [Rhodospirillaceae bacterium]
MMEEAAVAATFINLLKLGLVLGLTGLYAFALERVFGLDPKGDVDAFQKAAKDGNALPLALLYLGVIYFFAVVLGRFQ